MADKNPTRDEILLLMSAHLDGELSDPQQEVLFGALEADADLGDIFAEMAAFVSQPEIEAAFVHPPTTDGFGPGDQVDFAAALTDRVMAQIAPELVSNTANGTAQLASLFIDGELNHGGQIRLRATLERPTSVAASAVLGIVYAGEALHIALSNTPHSDFVESSVTEIQSGVESAIALDERADILFSASLDGQLSVAEQSELIDLQADGHGAIPRGFAHAAEAFAVCLRAPMEDPMAARAGAAALHAIEAQSVRRPSVSTSVPAASWTTRMRTWFGSAIPLAAAAGAAAIFFALESPKEPIVQDDFLAWAEEVIPEVNANELRLAAQSGTLSELLPNNNADVQALDAGTLAAVFTTEAHSVTVIWVPEPEGSGT